MKKSVILVLFLALTIVAAFGPTNPIFRNLNIGVDSFGAAYEIGSYVRSLLSFSYGKETPVTLFGREMPAPMVRIADSRTGDAEDNDKGDGKNDGKSEDQKDTGKEKEDGGEGWDRLWDAPKLG